MRPPAFPFQYDPHASGFLGAPALGERPQAPFAAAGIAWDGATTNRPGARFGPGAIRAASRMLCDATHPLWDISPREALADAGDLPLPNTSLAALQHALPALATPLICRHHMLWLGGDHAITLPLLRAYRAHYGGPLALLHFDAHCDTWQDHFNEPSGHGTWLFEAIDEGLVLPQHTVQIGIRSPAERATRRYVSDRGGLTLDARSLRGLDGALLEPVLAKIRTQLTCAAPLYLTLDIDALDPSAAPGTGTPEPAGLSMAQAATLLEGLASLPFIGMDLVEVSPPYDHAQLTSLAAAHLGWTYLAGRMAAGI
jgi:agmatinase